MAIRPEQAAGLTEDERRLVDAWEIEIDKTLQAKFAEQTNYIAIDIPLSATQRMIDAIICRYRDAGWRVIVEDDYRDGRWFRFEPIYKVVEVGHEAKES